MVHESLDDLDLQITSAFPKVLQDDVRRAASALPPPSASSAGALRIAVGNEVVSIPYRVYYDTKLINTDGLTPLQQSIINCLLTRHNNGFVREENLRRIVSCCQDWVPPFVIQLVGEYIVEILQVLHDSRAALDAKVYSVFLNDNRAFWATTKRRVVSYWDCYYRRTWPRREDYVGFELVQYIDSFLTGTDEKRPRSAGPSAGQGNWGRGDRFR